jgi:Protein of unknown function (DUF3887)
MWKIRIYIPLFISALALGLFTGCAPTQTRLTGADQQAILAFSEGMTDNLVTGMNANDYAVFSKDFDQAMLNAMNKSQFDSFKKDRDTKLGAYVSRKVSSVLKSGNYNTVIYDTKFEKDGNVTMRVVFTVAEPHQISGLWFNK